MRLDGCGVAGGSTGGGMGGGGKEDGGGECADVHGGKWDRRNPRQNRGAQWL